MISFKKTVNEKNEFDVSNVNIEFNNEVDLEEMCQQFQCFLKACGYEFDGQVMIVDDNVNSVDDIIENAETSGNKIIL